MGYITYVFWSDGTCEMLENVYETIEKAQDDIDNLREAMLLMDDSMKNLEGIFQILDEKDTAAGRLIIEVDGQTLYRVSENTLKSGELVYVYNPPDGLEASHWGTFNNDEYRNWFIDFGNGATVPAYPRTELFSPQNKYNGLTHREQFMRLLEENNLIEAHKVLTSLLNPEEDDEDKNPRGRI